MIGAVHNYLNNFFKQLGLNEENISGKTKIRTIRIQIALHGVNLANFNANSDDSNEALEKVKKIIQSLNLT